MLGRIVGIVLTPESYYERKKIMRKNYIKWIAFALTVSMIAGGSVTPVTALEPAGNRSAAQTAPLTKDMADDKTAALSEGLADDNAVVLTEDMADDNGAVLTKDMTDDGPAVIKDGLADDTSAVINDDMADDRTEETNDMIMPESVSANTADNNDGTEKVWDGYIPDEYLNGHDDRITIESSEAAMEALGGESLESKYITPAEYIPDVRDQDPFGTCWTFSVIAANEGYLIKNKSKPRSINLSERALCYFMYCLKGINDPLGNTLGDYNAPIIPKDNIKNIYDVGGSAFESAIFLANWGTPVDESRAPYSELEKMGEKADLTDAVHKGVDRLNDDLCYDAGFHLQNFRLIKDSDGIKKAIKDNGIISAGYYHDTGSRNKKRINFYNQYTHAYNSGSYHAGTTNHIISIIGWDDNFSRDNFNEACRPENNGAWLIRNSWGSEWGEGGNFWLSYEDKSLRGVVAFMPEDKTNYDNNYFYDGASGDESYGNGAGRTGKWRAANVFTAASDEEIKAVSIGIASTDVDYSVQIYKNPTDPKNPESGTPMLEEGAVKGRFTYQGYYTIPLNTSVGVKKGDTFAVAFTLGNDEKPTFAFVESDNYSYDWIKFFAQTDIGQSFYSHRTNAWYDLYSERMCFRIHAFTDNVTGKPAHNAEPISAELYRVHNKVGKVRLKDYAAALDQVIVDKYGVEESGKWSFKEPDRELVASNDQPTIKAEVVKKEGGNEISDYVLMNVTDVSFESLENIKPTMYTGSDPIKLETYASYIGYDLKKDLLVSYRTSDGKVMTLSTDGSFAYIVGEGTVSISADLSIKGSDDPIKTMTKKVTVSKDHGKPYVRGNVVRIKSGPEVRPDKAPESVVAAEMEAEPDTAEETPFDEITDGYEIVRGYNYYLEDTTEGYAAVFVSDDPSVLKIGRPDKVTKRSELIITGTGYVNVSCKINGKVLRTLRFVVTIPSVSLEKTSLDFNSALTDSTDQLDIYASEDIASISVTDDKKTPVNDFTVNHINGRTYEVRYTGSEASKNLNGYLKIKLKDIEEETYRPVSFKVKSTVPKVTVKQLAKVDVLYSAPIYSIGNLSVTLDEGDVDEIRLTDTGRNKGELAYSIYDPWYDDESEEERFENIAYASEFALFCTGDVKDAGNNKGTLEISVEGYKDPIKKDITIAYTKSNVKAAAIDTGVLTDADGKVLHGNKVRFCVTNTTTKKNEEYYEPDISIKDKNGNSVEDRYTGSYEENGIFVLVPKPGTVMKASGEDVFVTVGDDMHTSSVTAKLKIKGVTLNKAALKPGRSSVEMRKYNSPQINKALAYDVAIEFKNCGGCSELLKYISAEGMNAASKAALDDNKLRIGYVKDKNAIRLSYPDGNAPAAGTYKYRLVISSEKTGAAKDIDTTLNVKIKDAPTDDKCKVKLSGSIDVLDRDSHVEVIPKFSNLPGDCDHRISDVTMTGNGSDKYELVLDSESGELDLYLKEGEAVSTRDKQEFTLTYRIDIGDGSLTATAGKIKIPVKQGQVKGSIQSKNVYSNMFRSQKEELNVTLCNRAGSEIDIDKIELVNPNRDFDLVREGDNYFIFYEPNGAISRGKSYTLKFDVYPKDMATNEKPVRLTYKVSVAK